MKALALLLFLALPAMAAETTVGTRPAAEVTVPAFQAVNQEGQARTLADLQGSPTVLWFFPMAGTPG